MARWLGLERRWRDALLAATLPRPDDGSRPGLSELDVGRFYDELDQSAPWMVRNGFRAAVWSLSLAPPVVLGRPRTFRHLDPADQDRLLSRAASSRLFLVRQMVEVLKLMACFAYFRDGDVRAHMDEGEEAGP